jgi:hypothetical protein
MPDFTKLIFDHPVNSSLQVGDAIYCGAEIDGVLSSNNTEHVGNVLQVGVDYILVDKDPTVPPIITLGLNDFIFFAKNININESSLKGYYADVTFENSSNTKTELFAISSEVVPSSK